MIIYKRQDWLPAIWHFHTGPTAKGLLKRVALVGVYVTVISVAELNYID